MSDSTWHYLGKSLLGIWRELPASRHVERIQTAHRPSCSRRAQEILQRLKPLRRYSQLSRTKPRLANLLPRCVTRYLTRSWPAKRLGARGTTTTISVSPRATNLRPSPEGRSDDRRPAALRPARTRSRRDGPVEERPVLKTALVPVLALKFRLRADGQLSRR